MEVTKYILRYSLWDILIPKGYVRVDELSRWACKYCIKNNTDELKNYITNPDVVIIYCSKMGRDKELEEKHNLSNFPLFWISMNFYNYEISYRLNGKKAVLEIIIGIEP